MNNHRCRQIGAIGMTALVVALGMAAQMASAQSVTVRCTPLRITVPDSGTYANSVSNLVNLNNTGGATETLTVSGMPSGDTATITGTNGNSSTATFGTFLNNTAVNVADGLYTLDLNASGTAASTDFLLPLQVGRMWATEATNSTAFWSAGSSWIGGNPPGASSDVLFTGLGAQTNDFINGVFYTNSVVDQNFTIASLRFSQNLAGSPVHSLFINSGVTLTLTGANGLSLLPDAIPTTTMTAAIAGPTGALNVNNANANVTVLAATYSSLGLLDMSRLGTFTANINRFAPGDYCIYPGITNLQAEGFAGSSPFALPNQYQAQVFLALTNTITAHYTDPFNYTNVNTNRLYALEVANQSLSAPSSNAKQFFYLGISNAFNLDSVCVSGFGGTTATFSFNPSNAVNSSSAYFRNTDGVSRMSIFTVGDLASAITNNQGNTKGNVDFGTYGGTVNMLVDRFYMSRDRTNTLNASGDDAQTTFGMGAGIINANTMVIGDQETGDQINQGFVYGTLTVSNTGVIVVNKSLQLGYDVADYNDLSLPGVSHGILNINAGATVMANTIGVGGPSGVSGEVGNMGLSSGSASPNTISMNLGSLIVSNFIGSASALSTNYQTHTAAYIPGMLGVLNMVNSSLELFINGNNAGPYVNTCQLTFSGSTSNTIVIGSLQNVTVPASGSTNIPLIWVQDASPNASAVSGAFTKIVMPNGYTGALVQDATNTQILDLNISQHPPNTLKWEGYANNNTWDTTSVNWLNTANNQHYVFTNGDFVTFDDTAGTLTNITVSGAVQIIPGSITVNNTAAYYQFLGSPIIGGAVLTKSGTGFLEIDSSMTVNTLLTQGTLVGTGTIGGVNVSSGAKLNYSGSINGNVTCAGVGLNPGTINGQLIISSGGTFTNYNTLNGTFNAQSGSFMLNNGSIVYGLGTTGSIATNAVVENGGSLSGDVMTINGTFLDEGGASSITMEQFIVNPTGIFYPGDDALGSSTIQSAGFNYYSFGGALLLSQGSTIVFNVNLADNPAYTVMNSAAMSFGGSATAQTENGATIKMNNEGAQPFAAGQVYTLFQNTYSPGFPPENTGSSTNTFPVISPATPGPGLAWDLSQLWSSGSIGVIHPPVENLTNSFSLQGTNVVGLLSWSTNYAGWRLETQVDPPSVGLSLANSNWTSISGSWTNMSENITNTAGTNCVFYRLVYP